MAEALHDPWDVIIADYRMPHFSGVDALILLKEKDLDIPFIIVSGAIGEDIAVGMMKAGANDYLLKNNLTRLVPAIERELREAQGRQERRRVEDRGALLAALVECCEDGIIAASLSGKIH